MSVESGNNLWSLCFAGTILITADQRAVKGYNWYQWDTVSVRVAAGEPSDLGIPAQDQAILGFYGKWLAV